jgi:hypothetical protein
MTSTTMGEVDRFFGEVLVCQCGLAAPERSLADREGRERVLRRFKANPGPQLPDQTPDQRERPQGVSKSAPAPEPPSIQRPLCPQCGKQLELSKARATDRFFDEYLECSCGALCLNQVQRSAPSNSNKPYAADPDFEQVKKRESVIAAPEKEPYRAPPPEALELWGDEYWITIDSALPALLGLPRFCSQTQVMAGPWNVTITDSAYPIGFHAALPSFSRSLPDLRSDVGLLYERLLGVKFSGQYDLRCHLLAPLHAFCRVLAEESKTDTPPFEILRADQEIPGRALYLTNYLGRLLEAPLVSRKGRFISLVELGTTPGFIDPSSLDLVEDEVDLFKVVFGSYRFA